MVLNPYEDEGVIYESSEPINGNHVPLVEFHENLQQPFQTLCDQECEENHSYVSSDCSFSDFLFHEQTCEDQNGVHVELHAEIFLDIHHAHELDVVVQEHTNSFYDVEDVNDKKKQIVVIYFESDLKIEGIKHEKTTVKDETYRFPFAYQQVNVHVLKDPFASMLQSL